MRHQHRPLLKQIPSIRRPQRLRPGGIRHSRARAGEHHQRGGEIEGGGGGGHAEALAGFRGERNGNLGDNIQSSDKRDCDAASSRATALRMATPLKDFDLRRAAYARLFAQVQRREDTLVIDELGLSHGAARVDIAVINGHIRGVEIKAEADTLKRLPEQVVAYGKVVDRATLIASDRHTAAASLVIPDWWGLISATRAKNGRVIFRRLRAERTNRAVEPFALASLMWRSEVVDALSQMGCAPRLLRSTRTVLYSELVARLPKTRLATLVRDTLKAR